MMQHQLLSWYKANARQLPWRANRDPYRIWISEVMLQQTTTTAVIPYFERFIERFQSLEALARARESDVIEAWAGLGYYSRARNLHRAAKEIFQFMSRGLGFPSDHLQLIELPGFGPYTSRSVASLAFDEPVGVIDGNVIRVFARLYDSGEDWWKPAVRKNLQILADRWVQGTSSSQMNQALMELGRVICTPKSPYCNLCPLLTKCKARKRGTILLRPSAKPRKAREIWVWQPQVVRRGEEILLTQGTRLPFLNQHWVLPGLAKKVSSAPKKFLYKHTITHHDIYVQSTSRRQLMKGNISKWVRLSEIKQHCPASLVHKAIALSYDI